MTDGSPKKTGAIHTTNLGSHEKCRCGNGQCPGTIEQPKDTDILHLHGGAARWTWCHLRPGAAPRRGDVISSVDCHDCLTKALEFHEAMALELRYRLDTYGDDQ